MSIPSRFRGIVAGATYTAGAVGIPGGLALGADVPFLIGIWGTGAYLIASQSDCTTTKKQWVGVATACASGVATFVGGAKIAALFLPAVGPLAAVGLNASLDALFTYRFLRAVSKVYDRFDREEILQQALYNSAYLAAGLFSVFALPGDIRDMAALLSEGHAGCRDLFKA